MANIGKTNFYRKDPKSKKDSPINLHYHFDGQKFKFATGLQVNKALWNETSQRIKKSEGSAEANNYLKKISNEVEAIHLRSISAGKQVTTDYLRTELQKAISKTPKVSKGLFEYLEEYQQVKQGKISEAYLKKVRTLCNHLREFARAKRYKLSFESINLAFYDHYYSYLLSDLKLLNNTIASNISVLKTFLEWSTSRGYNTNLTFKNKEFKAPINESEIIYLTEKELMRLLELDLSQNQKLFNVRETFCFACFTGLRYSDVAGVKKENIRDDELKLTSAKTKKVLAIPLNDFALYILERNSYRLPVISNQKTNEYLKELCKHAGIDEPMTLVKFRGRDRVEYKEPKYNFITSHTARRTFVTLSLEKGMRAETVMEITGHTNFKMMKKYISITSQIKKIEMKKIWQMDTKLSVVS